MLFNASPTMANVYIYIYLFSIAKHSVSFNSVTLFHVGTFHLFTPIKGRKPVGISPRSKERGEREERGHIVNFNPISPAPTIPRIPSSLKWSFFSNSASRFDARFNQFSSSVHSAREYRDKKWKIFRVSPYVLSLYRSLRFFKFFFTKSFYLLTLFLARFLSLHPFFRFSKFFFYKILLFIAIDPRSFSFSTSSSFLQTIQSIYCDFSSFFKFTNSYLLRFFFIRFLSLYRFFRFSKLFFANYPKYSLQFFLASFLSFCIDSLDSPCSFSQKNLSSYLLRLFLARFHLRVHPISFEEPLNLDHRSSAQTMLFSTDSSLLDFSLVTPIHAIIGEQDTTEIPLHSHKRGFITATAVEFLSFHRRYYCYFRYSPHRL